MSDNDLIRVINEPAAPVTANYPEDGFGLVYLPAWFTSVGPELKVAAKIIDSPDFFMAGHWRVRSNAQGSPVVVYGDFG